MQRLQRVIQIPLLSRAGFVVLKYGKIALDVGLGEADKVISIGITSGVRGHDSLGKRRALSHRPENLFWPYIYEQSVTL